MRFRRRRFHGRGAREPLHWKRVSHLTNPWQAPVDGLNASIVDVFNPQTLVASQFLDESFTVRRFMMNRWPVLDVSATLVAVAAPFVAVLTWFIYVDDVNNSNIPANPNAIFQMGKDIVAGGSLLSQIFAGSQLQQSPPWFPGANAGQNFIDIKVNRKINTGEFLAYWSMGSFVPLCSGGTPVTPGEDNPPACWLHDADTSVLYQRTMRKR